MNTLSFWTTERQCVVIIWKLSFNTGHLHSLGRYINCCGGLLIEINGYFLYKVWYHRITSKFIHLILIILHLILPLCLGHPLSCIPLELHQGCRIPYLSTPRRSWARDKIIVHDATSFCNTTPEKLRRKVLVEYDKLQTTNWNLLLEMIVGHYRYCLLVARMRTIVHNHAHAREQGDEDRQLHNM